MKIRPEISIIIPSRNDRYYVQKRLLQIVPDARREVIVVTAGARQKLAPGPYRQIHSNQANRAYQMNLGASRSRGDILLFLHADTEIEASSLPVLAQTLETQDRYVGGCYQFALDHPGWSARIMEFGVLLREIFFRLPYGDQALFVRRDIFFELGGFPEVPILEDVLLVEKLRERGRLLYFEFTAKTSARKWKQRGFFQTMWVNWLTMLKWRTGASLVELERYRAKKFSHG